MFNVGLAAIVRKRDSALHLALLRSEHVSPSPGDQSGYPGQIDKDANL